MTRDELMQLAAEKVVDECSWKSIEFLFRPMNYLELFLRLDFEGAKRLVHSHGSVPWVKAAIEVEEFYRKIRAIKTSQDCSRF